MGRGARRGFGRHRRRRGPAPVLPRRRSVAPRPGWTSRRSSSAAPGSAASSTRHCAARRRRWMSCSRSGAGRLTRRRCTPRSRGGSSRRSAARRRRADREPSRYPVIASHQSVRPIAKPEVAGHARRGPEPVLDPVGARALPEDDAARPRRARRRAPARQSSRSRRDGRCPRPSRRRPRCRRPGSPTSRDASARAGARARSAPGSPSTRGELSRLGRDDQLAQQLVVVLVEPVRERLQPLDRSGRCRPCSRRSCSARGPSRTSGRRPRCGPRSRGRTRSRRCWRRCARRASRRSSPARARCARPPRRTARRPGSRPRAPARPRRARGRTRRR